MKGPNILERQALSAHNSRSKVNLSIQIQRGESQWRRLEVCLEVDAIFLPTNSISYWDQPRDKGSVEQHPHSHKLYYLIIINSTS